ncbi:transposase [Streptomyces sp. NBC_00079]|uniref:transposase n=1 Tax=Streptomyces sp. NBC_00079 TaxID=2975644 RepID=UPI003247F0FA
MLRDGEATEELVDDVPLFGERGDERLQGSCRSGLRQGRQGPQAWSSRSPGPEASGDEPVGRLGRVRAFLSIDVEIRKVICCTPAIESVNARIHKAVRARRQFPNEAAALMRIYMALMSLDPARKGRKTHVLEGILERVPDRLRGQPDPEQQLATQQPRSAV